MNASTTADRAIAAYDAAVFSWPPASCARLSALADDAADACAAAARDRSLPQYFRTNYRDTGAMLRTQVY